MEEKTPQRDPKRAPTLPIKVPPNPFHSGTGLIPCRMSKRSTNLRSALLLRRDRCAGRFGLPRALLNPSGRVIWRTSTGAAGAGTLVIPEGCGKGGAEGSQGGAGSGIRGKAASPGACPEIFAGRYGDAECLTAALRRQPPGDPDNPHSTHPSDFDNRICADLSRSTHHNDFDNRTFTDVSRSTHHNDCDDRTFTPAANADHDYL